MTCRLVWKVRRTPRDLESPYRVVCRYVDVNGQCFLVEQCSAEFSNLGAAVSWAIRQGRGVR